MSPNKVGRGIRKPVWSARRATAAANSSPRPILEVHWWQSGRKRAQPKAVSVMMMKSGKS
jgi:hypothetical protein